MDPKPQPNHARYIQILRRMTPEQRLAKAFELTQMSRELLTAGLRVRFPGLPENELEALVRKRVDKCRNQNW